MPPLQKEKQEKSSWNVIRKTEKEKPRLLNGYKLITAACPKVKRLLPAMNRFLKE